MFALPPPQYIVELRESQSHGLMCNVKNSSVSLSVSGDEAQFAMLLAGFGAV